MNLFPPVTSRIVYLPARDVDTDQIIPARYLKVTDKEGLAQGLFADWRYAADGTPVEEFPLNRPDVAGVRILMARSNFGCGSSREHAPWALVAFGFKVVIATSFADIFRSNSLKNALLPVVVEEKVHSNLVELAEKRPHEEVTVDLESLTIRVGKNVLCTFPVDSFSRRSLLEGIDELGYIRSFDPKIREFESKHPLTWAFPWARQ